MKINQKILNIPPYISTSWSHVKSLHMAGTALVVTLIDGATVVIPNLDRIALEAIFNTHATIIEQGQLEDQNLQHTDMFPNEQRLDIPFRIGVGSLEEFGAALQHNPSQAATPDIPNEILEKIIAITKIVTPEGITLPKPEAHCNCVHCQIARGMEGAIAEVPVGQLKDAQAEEIITDADLHFQQWQIIHNGSQMYTVINKLDTLERYNVFLGEPIGCTCGKIGCEHIVAVLKS